jgi:hypothetical protein
MDGMIRQEELSGAVVVVESGRVDVVDVVDEVVVVELEAHGIQQSCSQQHALPGCASSYAGS